MIANKKRFDTKEQFLAPIHKTDLPLKTQSCRQRLSGFGSDAYEPAIPRRRRPKKMFRVSKIRACARQLAPARFFVFDPGRRHVFVSRMVLACGFFVFRRPTTFTGG
ncbi:MAG TPA: hypothetical protein VGJ26_10715 [Pirellulales bacterium]